MILSGTLDKPSVKLLIDSTEVKGATFTLDKDMVSLTFERARTKFRLSGYISRKDIEGRGQINSGKWIVWKAAR